MKNVSWIFALFLQGCITMGLQDHILRDSDVNMQDLLPEHLWREEHHKSDGIYFYLLGEQRALTGDLLNAQLFYNAAFQVEPNAFLAQKIIGNEKFLREPADLLDDARRMILLYPQDATLRVHYAEILAKSGDSQAALKEVKEALRFEHDHVGAHVLYLGLLENSEEALPAAQEFVRQQPRSFISWSYLAHLCFLKKDYKGALKAAKKAYHLQDQQLEIAFFYLKILDLNQKQEPSTKLAEYLYENIASEEEFLLRAIAMLKVYGSPEAVLEKLSGIKSNIANVSNNIQLQKIYILWEINRNDEALEILTNLHEIYPDSQDLVYMLGRTYERTKKIEEAKKSYEGVHENSKYFMASQIGLIRILERQDLLRAISIYEELKNDVKATWEFHTIGATLYANQKNYKKALSILTAAYLKFPTKHRLLFLQGVYYEKIGAITACINTMKTVIEKDPINSAAYNYLGYLYAERNENLDEAEALILKALALKPSDGYYVDSLAYVYFQRKDFDKAQKFFIKALELAPNEPVILEHIADVYLAKDQKTEALEYLEKAVKLELEDRDRERVMKKYEDLKKGNP